MSVKLRLLVCAIAATVFVQPMVVCALYSPNDTKWSSQDELRQSHVDALWDPTDEDKLTNPGSGDIIVAIVGAGMDSAHEDLTMHSKWYNQDEYVGDNGQPAGLGDGYPGLQGIDDDGDGLADFSDPEVANRNYDRDDEGSYAEGDTDEWILACLDDDENGYPDDYYGYNFCTMGSYPNSGLIYDTTDDDIWGTRVAGIVAAKISNSNIGIAGVAQIHLMTCRVADMAEGITTDEYVKEAVVYAIANGADIILNLAIYEDDTEELDFLDTVIASATGEGIVWISPSGPEDDSHIWYPGWTTDAILSEKIVVVGACYSDAASVDEHRYPTSAYGSALDFLAPGYYVECPYWKDSTSESKYGTSSGVWYSAAIATGITSLLLTARPLQDYVQINDILSASCIDITANAGPKKDKDAWAGRDPETGFGEVDGAKAFGYSNYLRDRWSDGIVSDDFDLVLGEATQPAIAVDSDGFSHIVFIADQNGGETFYACFEPDGRLSNPPISVEWAAQQATPSLYPDVFIDCEKNVHVCWIERAGVGGIPNDQIYYRKMNYLGGFITNPTCIAVGAEKEYLNIMCTDPADSNPYIIYSMRMNLPTGWEWDIYNTRYVNPNWVTQGITWSNDKDERRPSADMGEINGVNELFLAYETHQAGNKIKVSYKCTSGLNWIYTIDDISNTGGYDNWHPNLCVLQNGITDCDVYVVWEIEDVTQWGTDVIQIQAIDGPTHSIITYPSAGSCGWQVSKGLVSEAEFPKVSASTIAYKFSRTDAIQSCQIDVIWRAFNIVANQWNLECMAVGADGRTLANEPGTIQYDINAYPQIASSQIRYPQSSSTTWLDFDGNYRVIVPYQEGANCMLEFLTTKNRWSNIEIIDDNNDNFAYPDVAIDKDNGIHMVYQDSASHIMYCKWNFDSRPPMAPAIAPIQISDGLYACKYPKVTTFVSSGTINAVVICYDYTQGDLWYYRISAGGAVLGQGRVACCPSADSSPEENHEIVNDVENGNIGIVWSEISDGRAKDIHFGIITYANGNVLAEDDAHPPVVGSEEDWVDDINPAIDIDTAGRYHIVFQMEVDPNVYGIFYNVAYKSGSYCAHLFTNDIVVNTQYDCANPAVHVDKDIHRRAGNNQDRDSIDMGTRSNKFIHISYSGKQDTTSTYVAYYTKYNDQGSCVIAEQDVSSWSDSRNFCVFTAHIGIEMSLNSENQIGLTLCGPLDDFISYGSYSAVYLTKLDNNGEILNSLHMISQTGYQDSDTRPSIEYDKKDNLNIAWEKDVGFKKIAFAWEKGAVFP